MKKMLTGLLVFSVWAGGLSSMAREKGPATDFSLNLGIQTNAYGDSTFRHVWLSLDARAGLKVWGNLEISPEVMAVVDGGLDFTAVWVYPGAMLNLRLGAAFIGAGAVLPVVFVEGGTGTGSLAMKANAGYRTGPVILTVFALASTEETLHPFHINFVGATLGIGF